MRITGSNKHFINILILRISRKIPTDCLIINILTLRVSKYSNSNDTQCQNVYETTIKPVIRIRYFNMRIADSNKRFIKCLFKIVI